MAVFFIALMLALHIFALGCTIGVGRRLGSGQNLPTIVYLSLMILALFGAIFYV